MSNLTTAIQLTRASRYRLNNGQHIPVAGFGIYDLPKAESYRLVYEALKAGYRHIDGAVAYGNEEEAARAIADFCAKEGAERKDIWFTTKIPNGEHGYDKTKACVAAIAEKVKRHIDYVDMVLVHLPKLDPALRLGTWKALQELVMDPANKTLQIHTIGVLNYGERHLREILEWDGLVVPPAVNQLELHPWLPRLELRRFMVAHGILAEAYSPLTQGVKLDDSHLAQVAKDARTTPAELLLRWLYLQGFIVLARTSKVERIAQNLAVLAAVREPEDPLDEPATFGKVDLEPAVVEALDKPDAQEVLTWGGVDPTLYEP